VPENLYVAGKSTLECLGTVLKVIAIRVAAVTFAMVFQTDGPASKGVAGAQSMDLIGGGCGTQRGCARQLRPHEVMTIVFVVFNGFAQ